MLPIASKIFEKVVLIRLKQELEQRCPLHQAQRGFTNKMSTCHNLYDLLELLKKAKESAQSERRRTKVTKMRRKQFIVFFDFKKAFDSVDKVKLVKKLEARGLTNSLIRAIELVIARSTGTLGDTVVQN